MSTPTTNSRDTFPCGWVRRMTSRVPSTVATVVVRLSGLGDAVRRLAGISGLSARTTTDLRRVNGMQLRRAISRRAPEVTTDCRIPSRVSLPETARHKPTYIACQENMREAHAEGTSDEDISAVMIRSPRSSTPVWTDACAVRPTTISGHDLGRGRPDADLAQETAPTVYSFPCPVCERPVSAPAPTQRPWAALYAHANLVHGLGR